MLLFGGTRAFACNCNHLSSHLKPVVSFLSLAVSSFLEFFSLGVGGVEGVFFLSCGFTPRLAEGAWLWLELHPGGHDGLGGVSCVLETSLGFSFSLQLVKRGLSTLACFPLQSNLVESSHGHIISSAWAQDWGVGNGTDWAAEPFWEIHSCINYFCWESCALLGIGSRKMGHAASCLRALTDKWY